MWVIDLEMEVIIFLANMFHREKRSSRSRRKSTPYEDNKYHERKQLATCLTGTLGAMTPVLLLILVTDKSLFWLEADLSSYLMLLAWLPLILIGTVLGGLLGLHTGKTRPDSQVVLVAYIWGLIGGLIPGILLFVIT